MDNYKKGGFNKGGSSGFRKPGGFNDRKSFSKPSFGGSSDFKKKSWDKGTRSSTDDRPMFSATCSGCGKSCQVPFKPANGKPVFCDDCFMKTRNGESPARNDSRPSYNNDRSEKPAAQNNDVLARQMQVISGKLDQLIELMAKKSTEAPKAVVEKTIAKETVKEVAPKTVAKKAVVAKAVKKVVAKKVAAKKVAKKK